MLPTIDDVGDWLGLPAAKDDVSASALASSLSAALASISARTVIDITDADAFPDDARTATLILASRFYKRR